MREELGRLAEVVSGVERRDVGIEDLGLAPELPLEPLERRRGGPVEHPRHEPEREHVLGALRLLLAHTDRLDRPNRDGGHRDRIHLVAVERAVGARVGRVARLVEVALLERVLVQDQRAAAHDRPEVGLQRGRVHRDQHVRVVTGRRDVGGRELDLERRHAVDGARRSADLGGEIGQRGEVVADQRGRVREPVSRELHPVAGVAGEPDDDAFSFLDGRAHLVRIGVLLGSGVCCRRADSVLRPRSNDRNCACITTCGCDGSARTAPSSR